VPALEAPLVALGIAVLAYALLVLALVLLGRKTEAVALARFIPDCLALLRGLLRDPRVPRRRKLVLVALVGYLATPIDLVPDFIPVAGQLDDVIVAAIALRYVLSASGPELLREHWPGPEAGLGALIRAVHGAAPMPARARTPRPRPGPPGGAPRG
jgi:uncharacterized membrane protein YkvA (DUF1232 family)